MKLNGDFILREVVGEYVLVPVGDTALKFSGVISLNPVGASIWKGLSQGRERSQLLADILEEFEVSEQEAGADLDEFLDMLRSKQLLEYE